MHQARIRVVDIEATGFLAAEGHTPCEVGYCDLVAVTTDLAGAPASWCVVGGLGQLLHPGRPIPPEASAVHQIVDADVARAAPWGGAMKDLLTAGTYGLVAFAAHSAKTEQQWVTDEITGSVPWIDSYKVALRLVSECPKHSVQGLRHYMAPLGIHRSIADVAHRAFPDAYVTAFLLRDMLIGSPVSATASIEKMVEWSSEPALQIWCHIGSWRGKRWREVDTGFLDWVAARDFDEDVLFTVRHEIERRDALWREQQALEGT